MSTVISFLNNKGGVAKTTSTINIGAALNQLGYKVLLVDLDAQASLTQSLGFSSELENTVYEALIGEIKASEAILQKKEGFDIIPAQLGLSMVEIELAGEISRESILKDLLAPIKSNYDFILLDCSPAIGLLTMNALVASDKIIIPILSEYLAIKGMNKLLGFADKIKRKLNPNLNIAGLLLTRFSARKNLSQMVEQSLRDNFGTSVLKNSIRENISLAEAPTAGLDIFDYAPKSAGASDYLAVCKELLHEQFHISK